ncbi:hypothetical protein D3C72_1703840 [compost metagenome]
MQTGHSTLHRQHSGMQNVQLVDFFWLSAAQAPGQRFLDDLVIQRQAALLTELLRVRQANDRPRGIEDHRSGNHCANQRATAHFVHACN